jgi:hypothetical protein
MGSYWYWRQLKNGWTLDEATTNRFDLPERGALSGLYIDLFGTLGATINDTAESFPVQMTTIRVVGNGNFEIVNCRGRQLHAMNFWDDGVLSQQDVNEQVGWVNHQHLVIPFGRYLGDEKYGLWLEKFGAGIQVEDTNTISTSVYTDATSKWDVFGLFRKNAEASLFSGGFFRKRNICTKTAATETQYPYKLPTENKLKQIYVFSEPTNTSNDPSTTPFTLVSKLWLSIKSKEEYLIDNLNAAQVCRMMHNKYGRTAHTKVQGYTTGGGHHVDTMIYERDSSQALVDYSDTAGGAWMVEYDDNTFERTAQMAAFTATGSTTSRSFWLDSWGTALHGMTPLLMIDPDENDEPDYLDAKANADVYVEATEGASTGKWYIALDELEKTYPS